MQLGLTPGGVSLLETGLHQLGHQNWFLETTNELLLVLIYHAAFLPLLLSEMKNKPNYLKLNERKETPAVLLGGFH